MSSADVVVAAIRQPEMVKKEWVKPGAVVIDVGINSILGGHGISHFAFNSFKIMMLKLLFLILMFLPVQMLQRRVGIVWLEMWTLQACPRWLAG